MSERTLAIIKPDAVKKNAIGDIIARYDQAGLEPVAIRMMQFSKTTAEGFYAVHKARPFFDSLCTFMVSGPVVVLVKYLQGCRIRSTMWRCYFCWRKTYRKYASICSGHYCLVPKAQPVCFNNDFCGTKSRWNLYLPVV